MQELTQLEQDLLGLPPVALKYLARCNPAMFRDESGCASVPLVDALGQALTAEEIEQFGSRLFKDMSDDDVKWEAAIGYLEQSPQWALSRRAQPIKFNLDYEVAA